MGYAPSKEWGGQLLMSKRLVASDVASAAEIGSQIDTHIGSDASKTGRATAEESDVLSSATSGAASLHSGAERGADGSAASAAQWADDTSARQRMAGVAVGRDASFEVDARESLPRLDALIGEVAVQSMYACIAAFGVTLLLAPFGGPTVSQLLAIGAPGAWLSPWDAMRIDGIDVAVAMSFDGSLTPWVGASVGVTAACTEMWRLGVLTDILSTNNGARAAVEQDVVPSSSSSPSSFSSPASSETQPHPSPVSFPHSKPLQYSAAQTEQMRPLFKICGRCGAQAPALASIVAWQLAIALAEELYYRGFLQSALRFVASLFPSVPPLLLAEAAPLVFAAAIFGLVHTEFVPDEVAELSGDGTASDSKLHWFLITGSYGALYGMLFVLFGHSLEAPICMHAGINSGLCLRDWQRMQNTPSDALEEMFASNVNEA